MNIKISQAWVQLIFVPDFPHVFTLKYLNNSATIGPYKFNLDIRAGDEHRAAILRGVRQNFTVRPPSIKVWTNECMCTMGIYVDLRIHFQRIFVTSCLYLYCMFADRIFDFHSHNEMKQFEQCLIHIKLYIFKKSLNFENYFAQLKKK